MRSVFLSTTERLAADVSVDNGVRCAAHYGDARRLPLEDASVQAVLTSPPYCTRIDYAASTEFELALLGVEDISDLRRSMMGTTALRRNESISVPREWPESVRRLLKKVRDHSSHRSEEYYFRNLRQYFSDAIASIVQIARVLRSGGAAILVLQTSYYKEIEIDLPRLFLDMGRRAGLNGDTILDTPVRRVMTTINSAAREYDPQRTYREAVIRLMA